MKHKILLSTLFAFACLASTKAQINKGTTWLGGSIAYGYAKSDYRSVEGSKLRTILVNPAIGKVVKENLVAGVFVTYQDSYVKNANSLYHSEEKQIGGGLFVRKYIPVLKQLYIFGEGSVNAKNYKGELITNDGTPSRNLSKTKGWDAGISITPGVSFAVKNSIHLEAGFNSLFSAYYQKRKSSNTSSTGDFVKSKSFGGGVSAENESQLYIGFRFLLNNKG